MRISDWSSDVCSSDLRMGGSKPYEEAIDDLDGAVRWARPIGLPVVLWGSSYSASLVIPVASSYPEMVKAVLSFSPGDYMQDKHSVVCAAQYLPQPIFITSSKIGRAPFRVMVSWYVYNSLVAV